MIRTPPHWGADAITRAYTAITIASRDRALQQVDSHRPLDVRSIGLTDLRYALQRGIEDFAASRTDVIFLCLMYPLAGLLLARLASGYELLPLLFPLASGFALVGPLAGVGLNEMSRRREKGLKAGWFDAFGVFASPSILGIMLLGGVLLGMMVFWLVMSQAIYVLTLGPQPPATMTDFANELLYTHAGHLTIFIGIGTGFVFALVALVISVVSFPLLLDRNISVETAVRTSVEVARRNPATIATWGVIIAGSLVLGSLPLLLGLIFVMPVLGHATWHLYRRAVPAALIMPSRERLPDAR